jgi:Acetyltransferase (GNAT) domain
MIEPMSIGEWFSFDAVHPAPTFFARPAWAAALATAFPHMRPHPVWVTREGTRVLIPLMQGSGGRLNWRSFVGMPLGTYTCALREDGSLASAKEFEVAIVTLSRFCDSLTIVPWPLGPMPGAHDCRQKARQTAIIDLSRGADEALQRVSGVTRRMAGQAARRGVTCAPLRSGLGVSTYYGMLREASEHWGLAKPPFPKELPEALVGYGGDDVEFWFAQHEAHPIAGGIVVYGSQELFFWSAAMRQNFVHLRPSNALNFALIRAGAERNMHWYNLGASEGLPGVERFKRGLGARTVSYSEHQHKSMPFNAYTHLTAPLRRLRAPQARTSGGQ